MLQVSEAERIDALHAMFARFSCPELEAVARARILYDMQIGYDDGQLGEPMEARNRPMRSYLIGFTGQTPLQSEVDALVAYARAADAGKAPK